MRTILEHAVATFGVAFVTAAILLTTAQLLLPGPAPTDVFSDVDVDRMKRALVELTDQHARERDPFLAPPKMLDDLGFGERPYSTTIIFNASVSASIEPVW